MTEPSFQLLGARRPLSSNPSLERTFRDIAALAQAAHLAERRSTRTLEVYNGKGAGCEQALGGTGFVKVSLLHAARVHSLWLSSHQKTS